MARLPRWLRTERHRRTLQADAFQEFGLEGERLKVAVAHLREQMAKMGQSASDAAVDLRRLSEMFWSPEHMTRSVHAVTVQVGVCRDLNRWAEVRSAGEWGRYYVRGALDPRFTTEEARDRYIQGLTLTGQEDAAAAFLAGWVEHHDGEAPETLAAHRLWGNTRVLVGTA